MAGLPVGHYGVSKAGLHFLLTLYGLELASDGIIVASIFPGMVDTDGIRLLLERAGESVRATLD